LSAEGGNPDVANLVQTQVSSEDSRSTLQALAHSSVPQFEGKMTYGTRCKTCRTTSERVEDFHELEVNLKVRAQRENDELQLTSLSLHSPTASWKNAFVRA